MIRAVATTSVCNVETQVGADASVHLRANGERRSEGSGRFGEEVYFRDDTVPMAEQPPFEVSMGLGFRPHGGLE